MNKYLLYLRTIRYLTVSQIYFKLLMFLKKKFRIIFYQNKPKIQSYSGESNVINIGPKEIHDLLGRHDRVSVNETLSDYTFTFLNKSKTFNNNIEWNVPEFSFLWNYNLHYLEYIFDIAIDYSKSGDLKYYQIFKYIIKSWIENNRDKNSQAWQPYPTSLRIVALIKSFVIFDKVIEPEIRTLLKSSIYEQAHNLEKNIEYHLLNNHIIENARALFLAGMLFEDKNSERWYKKGFKLLLKELKRQVLSDGGQFELSPMYHTVVLLVYLDVYILLSSNMRTVPEVIPAKIQAMFDYLKDIVLPDGNFAFVNDSANGMTVNYETVKKVMQIAGFDCDQKDQNYNYLKDSGFFVYDNKDEQAKLIFDVGAMGPDFQPGHGHSDILSFVWAWKGNTVFIDSGVDDYYLDSVWREYFRSTRAHNTLTVNDENQSELWGNFRVGRRARPGDVRINKANELVSVSCSHDGYKRFKGKPVHNRTVGIINATDLLIVDEMTGNNKQKISSYLHVNPDFSIVDKKKGCFTLSNGKETIFVYLISCKKSQSSVISGQTDPYLGWYAREFGVIEKSLVLQTEMNDTLSTISGYFITPKSNYDINPEKGLTYNENVNYIVFELSFAGKHFTINYQAGEFK